MRFEHWFKNRRKLDEDNQEQPQERPSIGDALGFNKPKINRQDLSRQIYNVHGMWVGPNFMAFKRDGHGGWFFDWSATPGMIPDPEEVQPGDGIGDSSVGSAVNGIPYWTVTQVVGNRIYVQPKENNPFASGVGAGGARWNQHDTDVVSGEYEQRRQNDFLDAMKSRRLFDPSDVAYQLMGTIPVHIGPNLSQGGQYSSNSSHNRANELHPDWGAAEVQKADAATLKKHGFLVPAKALEGRLPPREWDSFVSGQADARAVEENPDLAVEGEDFNNPQACARMVLQAKEPYLKRRNLERLMTLYSGYGRYRRDMHQVFEYMRSDELKQKFWSIARQNGLEEGDKSVFDEVWGDIHDGYIFRQPPRSPAAKALQIAFENNPKLKEALQTAQKKLIEEDQEKYINQLQDHWEKGDYKDQKILPVLKYLAKSMSNVYLPHQQELAQQNGAYKHFDPYFSTKKMLVDFAASEGWRDVVEQYRDSFDTETKERVFDAYAKDKNLQGMWYMLNKENHPENLSRFIYELGKVDEPHIIHWCQENLPEIIKLMQNPPEKDSDGGWRYHGAELARRMFHYFQRGKDAKSMMTLLNAEQDAENMADFIRTLALWDHGKYRSWVKSWSEVNEDKLRQALQTPYQKRLRDALDTLDGDEDEV